MQRLPRYDAEAYLLSLPHLLDASETMIAECVPYLRPAPERVAFWGDRLPSDGTRRIGIAWSGNPHHENDRQRSIDPALLAPLTARTACTFYCLTPEIEPPDGIRRLPVQVSDFADTAAVLANLDLVISVDTAVAHLAGALGCALWLLLPFVPDWRWQLGRERSVWYPSARLFRQSARRDWREVISVVAATLAQAWQPPPAT